MQRTSDIHIRSLVPLTPPQKLIDEFPLTEKAAKTVVEGREAVRRILAGEDRRMLVVVGPCSIHDERAALEYAERLRAVAERLSDRLFIVMRVYFEKPRTTVGWKGLINDPHLDGSFDIPEGLRRARKLLLQINEMGLPAATEMLDPVTPQYTADLVTWASIGARTTESQTHRQMASGLSMPVGFKNATDGNLQIAIDAMYSARAQHSFLGTDVAGRLCIVNTTGNPLGHIILRGGRTGTNYDPQTVQDAVAGMTKAGLAPNVMIDCSHANSEKDHRKQEGVWNNVLEQRAAGATNIIGLMLESNLHEGQQKLTADLSQLKYGVSITDACLGWEKTEELLEAAAAAPAPQEQALGVRR
ncbi:MAG: 3-deoxy-7-phosphoheptulonate synthase [Planctomycetaceae bacterium]|nr:3-deoxy-7-phosphoheptulonate synthase [Planctomycetaceae bacterium]